MSDLLRVYEPSELGPDGYPEVWHKGAPAVKDLVREQAGHRCVRCLHPFVVGETPGEWSPCDEQCQHGGPVRFKSAWTGQFIDRLPDQMDLNVHNVEFMLGSTVAPGSIAAQWRVLTVHHLNGVKADLRWWNLAALCQRDHLEIQGRVRMEQVFPYEHSAWFKPYAAGYYAATYLGEDLDREETEGRLDELLGLELSA